VRWVNSFFALSRQTNKIGRRKRGRKKGRPERQGRKQWRAAQKGGRTKRPCRNFEEKHAVHIRTIDRGRTIEADSLSLSLFSDINKKDKRASITAARCMTG